MLRIQLCPEGELENEHWYTYDALVFCVMAMLTWMAAGFWLNTMRDEILRLNDTAETWDKQTAEAQPMLQRHKALKSEIDVLDRKIEALKRITLNHPEKIRPIVVMEQLQTLRPEGLWYLTLTLDDSNRLKIQGASMDSLLISEFLLGMRETMNPETWTNDVRTQVGFQNITVKEMIRIPEDLKFLDLPEHLKFEASAEVAAKAKGVIGPNAMGPLPRSKFGVRF